MPDIYTWTPEQLENAKTFFGGAPTPEQIYQTANQYGLSPSEVSSIWSQATGGDYNTGLQAVNQYQTATGQTLAGGYAPTLNQQAAQDLITQAYGGIGRTTAGTGSSGLTSDEINYWAGQLQSGAITPEQFNKSFQSAVTGYMQQNPDDPYTKYVSDYLVNKGYKDVLNRAPEDAGGQYWKQQLTSGAISPFDLENVIAKNAAGTDRIAAQKFLGEDYYAPEEFLTRTGGKSYQEVVDYVAQNINDPTKVYQAAQQYNVNPNDVMSAMQAKGYGQLATLSDVEKFFQQGQEGFTNRYNEILTDTFGNPEEQARLEKILGLKEGDLNKIYNPEQFSKSSIENIEDTLHSSRINKIQDGLITKAIAKDVLGYTDDEMKTLVSDLAQNKESDPVLKGIFDSLKSGNRMTQDEFESLMIDNAKNNPDAEIFKRNPELLTRYQQVTPTQGLTGQYGYYNNAPVLNMSALDRYFKDSNTAKVDLGANNDFGWATSSNRIGEARTGAAVFGVKATPQQIKNFDKVEQEIKNAGGLQTKTDPEGGTYQGIYRTVTDPETGKPYTYFASLDSLYGSVPGYDEGGNPKQDYLDTRSQLESAAQKLKIDPSKYGTTKELYDAVQDASKNLYLVIGKANGWDPNIAKASGIVKTDAGSGDINSAAVLYQRFGDKGLAVQTPQAFRYDDPKKKKWYQELASIPGIAELSLLTPFAEFYPLIKGAQVGLLGGSGEDILKNVALSYVGRNILPDFNVELTADIGNQLIQSGISPEIAGTLADAGARIALNTGMSVLAGKDIGEAAERSLLSYGLGKGISGGLSLADFPKEYQPEVARLLTEGVMTGNFGTAAQNAIFRYGGKQLKTAFKDIGTPIPTGEGPTLQAARGGLAQAHRPVKSFSRGGTIRRDVKKLIPLRRSGLSYI